MDIAVYHVPEAVPQGHLPQCAVVVDVLRATTTIATALAAGAEAVQVFADLETLEATSTTWPEAQRLRAGERGGETVAGFDLGNSPFDYTPEMVKGKRIFMSTTNGTRSLATVQAAPTVITAALVNVSTVVSYILEKGFETVWVVGSGWQGAYALEDTVCAGAIVATLASKGAVNYANDEAVAAEALYQQWHDNLLGILRQASHGQRLLRLDRDRDLEYCAALDSIPVLPLQSAPGVLARYV